MTLPADSVVAVGEVTLFEVGRVVKGEVIVSIVKGIKLCLLFSPKPTRFRRVGV